MEYWHMDTVAAARAPGYRNQPRHTGPGAGGPGVTLDELDVYMADHCYPPPPPPPATHPPHPSGPQGPASHDARPRDNGCHQLPESPPDSGSEHPYSPNHDYMLLHDSLQPHEISGYGVYEVNEVKGDLADVVVLHEPTLVPVPSIPADHHHYHDRYAAMRVEVSELETGMFPAPLPAAPHPPHPPPGSKKRKLSQDVKCEPAALSPALGSETGEEGVQTIRFGPFQQSCWAQLLDATLKPIRVSYGVTADKGFNYSLVDEAFVCQKKNHFQVTCQIAVCGEPAYVQTSDGYKKISAFRLHFYGVKAEDPSQEVRIEQSQSDRTKKPFHPVPVELSREGSVKLTVGRLHFAETTNNNMRKKGRPNPDQRHFLLCVALRAHHHADSCMVAAQATDRIIVRASNPGQFESDCGESWWQRGATDNSVHFAGRVGINTDRPDEACVINGNLKVMGAIVQPSDARAKHDVQELDTRQQLRNVQNIRVVKFNYDPTFAQHSGLVGWAGRGGAAEVQWDAGVIAQEVRTVLPDAVKEAGDVTLPNGDTIRNFLVVNKDRIYMENIGAVKELCKLTDQLEQRLGKLEHATTTTNTKLQRALSDASRFSNASSVSGGDMSVERNIARSIKRHECCHKLHHHSPKYTRKQCRNCHVTKYTKYYHNNKMAAKCNKDDNFLPMYSDTDSIQKEEDSRTVGGCMAGNKESCVWVRGDDSSVGAVEYCCARARLGGQGADDGGEFVSNKLLQLVIAVLVTVMAVCLVVMSGLYFREHRELLSMRELSLHTKLHTHTPYTTHTTHCPPTKPYRSQPNMIQTLKPSLQFSKKTSKEKAATPPPADLTTTSTTEQPRHQLKPTPGLLEPEE